MSKRYVLTKNMCQCPVAWHSQGVRVRHTPDCPIWQWQHPVAAWLRKIRKKVSR